MNQNREEEARVLGKMLAEHEKALEQAVEIARREEPIVLSLRRAISALMETKPQIIVHTAGGNGNGGNVMAPTIQVVDGQHRLAAIAAMARPTRRAEYAQLTAIEAMRVAFEKISPSGFIHVDKIVEEIYNPIENKDTFYRIKRTLVSEIIRGMSKGMFIRGPQPNSFGLPPTRNTRTAHG